MTLAYEFAALFLSCFLISPLTCSAQSQETDKIAERGEERLGSAWGTVILAGAGRPLRHARVEFLIPDTGWSASALTDDQGRFDISGLALGSYHVSVVAPGCQTWQVTMQVQGRSGPLLLTLPKIETRGSPRNDHVISSQELALGDKGQKAFSKGVRLLLKGQMADSMPYFTRAIAQNPRHYRAYYNLGLAQLRLGQMENAQHSLQQAIDLSGGGFAPAQFLMGVVLCQQQDYWHAESIIQRGLELDPGSATGKYFLGLAQLALGRIADAEKSATQALSRREDLAEAYTSCWPGSMKVRATLPA